MSLAKEYIPWLLGFIFVNIIATFIMLDSNELIGDLKGTVVSNPYILLLSLILIVITYFFLMWPFFISVFSIKIKKLKFNRDENIISLRLGFFILFIQVCFFLFNSYYGVNVAGTNNKTADTPLALIWVLIPADALFVVYYAFYRDSKFFKVNLIFWLFSNIIRGWAGVILFVIFFEWCRLVRRNALSFTKIFIAVLLVLILYPLLTIAKWVIRASGGRDFSFEVLYDAVLKNLNEQSYLDLIYFGLEHIIGRLQLTSILNEIINMKDKLQFLYQNNDFQPFWMEGLHGILIERLFYGEKTRNLGVAFTEYANFNWVFEVGDWNINASLPAWFFISPWSSVLYLLYIFSLCFFSVFLVKLIGQTNSARDLIWLSWLVYLVPLWLGTFVALIYALFVFLLLKCFFATKVHQNASSTLLQ